MQSARTKQPSKHSHFSRRLMRETSSMSKSAIEDYHGVSSVAVPFNWESEPGTPKVNSSREILQLPPLTPPPSYFSSVSSPKSAPKKSTKSLFGLIFVRATKRDPSELSPVSSSSSSSGYSSPWNSVPSSPMTTRLRQSRRFGKRNAAGETEYGSSPVSTLCFREGRKRCSSVFKVLLRDV